MLIGPCRLDTTASKKKCLPTLTTTLPAPSSRMSREQRGRTEYAVIYLVAFNAPLRLRPRSCGLSARCTAPHTCNLRHMFMLPFGAAMCLSRAMLATGRAMTDLASPEFAHSDLSLALSHPDRDCSTRCLDEMCLVKNRASCQRALREYPITTYVLLIRIDTRYNEIRSIL